MSEPTMSFREFAKDRGYSESMVRKWIEAGRITEPSIDYTNPKRPRIYVNRARLDLSQNEGGKFSAVNNDPAKRFKTRHNKGESSGPKAGMSKKELAEYVQNFNGENIDLPNGDADENLPGIGAGFEEYLGLNVTRLNQVRLIRDIQLMDVKIGESSKRLVPKEEVYAALFEAGQEIRDAILAVADRVVDDVMLAKNRTEAYEIIAKEIHLALTGLSGADRKLP